MIEIKITKDQIERANKLYPFDNLNGSITKGKSQLFGALGEILVNDFYKEKGRDVKIIGDYNYDLLIENYKVDVKTKRTTVIPKNHYNCSISNWNTKQECDYYYFVRIMENLEKGYLLGAIKKDDFFKKAVFNKKGSLDFDGFSFKDDCYNLQINELKIK